MLRNALLAAATLITLLPAGAAMASNAWTTTALNFRQGPGTYYPVVHALPYCAALTTYEWQNGWVRAEWDGNYGWVSGRYVSDSNAHCQSGYVAPAPSYQAPATTYHAPVRRSY